MNGTHYGTGNDNIEFRGGEATFSGTRISFKREGAGSGGNKTFDSSADLYFQNGFYINPNLIVTNNGTVTINFQLLGANASSTWVNAAGATLNVEDNLLVGAGGGILVASATGNTVNYNGGAETLKQPLNNDYYNLIVSGSGTKTLQGDINVLNDLSITSTLARLILIFMYRATGAIPMSLMKGSGGGHF